MAEYDEPELPRPAWAVRIDNAREKRRNAQAQVIIDNGHCEGCGSKIKKRLAMRHVLACSVAHMNREED